MAEALSQAIQDEIVAIQTLILAEVPEAHFKLEPPDEDSQAWSLYIYTPTGNMQLTGDVMGQLDAIWRNHRLTVLAVVYPLTLYEE